MIDASQFEQASDPGASIDSVSVALEKIGTLTGRAYVETRNRPLPQPPSRGQR